MKTAFQRPKAGSYETGDKMSLTHHKQIDKIRPHLDMRSEMPFQFCLSHAVSDWNKDFNIISISDTNSNLNKAVSIRISDLGKKILSV